MPGAVSQILGTFTSLANAVGSDTINMSLEVSYIDGKNNTLAYASFKYSYGGGKPYGMGIRVDAADFNNADAEGTGDRAEALKSTIAHELMHSVMQYTLTDGMSGRFGEKYPTWFIEGTAQLAGWLDKSSIPLYDFKYQITSCSFCNNLMSVPVLRGMDDDEIFVGVCPACGEQTEMPLQENIPDISCPVCGAKALTTEETGHWD